MPRIVHIAAKVIGAIFGLIITLLLVWFAVNLFDRPLSASARAILAPPPDPYRATDNVYVALVGFDAPAGKGIITVGQDRIDEANRLRGSTLGKVNLGWDIVPVPPTTKLQFKGQADAHSLLTAPAWSAAREQRAQIAALTDANQELYHRYLSLHGMHGYFESAGDPASGLLATTPLRSLFLVNTANSIRTGTPSQQQAAMRGLDEDLQLWRTVLDGTGGILAKIVAARALHADLLLLGDMVTDPGCDLTLLQGQGDSLLTPFSLRNWQIGNAYEVEMRWDAQAFAVVPRGASDAPWPQRVDSWFGRQFFKVDATDNLLAQRTQHLRALAEGDPATYLRRQEAYEAWVRHDLSPVGFYNPVGRALAALSTLNDNFPAQVYDVAAFQRLVFLAYQMRLHGVPSAEVAQFMVQHPEWSTHPVGGAPFRWEPASGRLAVLPIGHEPPGQIFALTLHDPQATPGH